MKDISVLRQFAMAQLRDKPGDLGPARDKPWGVGPAMLKPNDPIWPKGLV